MSLSQSVLFREVPLYVRMHVRMTVLTLRWSELSALYFCSVGELCLPFIQCPVCRREFMSADFLQSHIGRRHPDHLPSKVKCVCVRACVCVCLCTQACVYMSMCCCVQVSALCSYQVLTQSTVPLPPACSGHMYGCATSSSRAINSIQHSAIGSR